jgi:FkbM family methyltransferase
VPTVTDLAAVIAERGTFVVRERRARREVASYTLAGSGAVVCLRHGTHDLEVLHEIFVRRAYAIPAHVEEVLLNHGQRLAVVDLGANVGLFGVYAQTTLPIRSITAVEPDPDNLVALRMCARANGREVDWRVVDACVGTSAGTVDFIPEQFAMSHIAHGGESISTVAVPRVDVFPLVQHADLIKIDIEGGEWEILRDTRLAQLETSAVVLEFHPRLCPAQHARAFAEERLAAGGFTTGYSKEEVSGRGMLWAWK